MKHASSRQVFNYWTIQRGQRLAPERADIEPGPIRRALGDTFILGRDAQGIYRFRLAGTRLCAMFCRELKGADFLSLWPAGDQALMRDGLAAASEEAAGFVAGITARTDNDASTELELLLLPLHHRDRTRSRMIGVLAPLAPPYWLGTRPVETMTCGTIRHLGPDSRMVPAPRLVPGIERRREHGLVVHAGGRS